MVAHARVDQNDVLWRLHDAALYSEDELAGPIKVSRLRLPSTFLAHASFVNVGKDSKASKNGASCSTTRWIVMISPAARLKLAQQGGKLVAGHAHGRAVGFNNQVREVFRFQFR